MDIRRKFNSRSKPRPRPKPVKVSKTKRRLKLLRNLIVFLLFVFIYGVIMLRHYSKKFYEEDKKTPLNYMTKKPFEVSPFAFNPDSYIAPIKEKKANGIFPETGWNQVYIDPKTGSTVYDVNVSLSPIGARTNFGLDEGLQRHFILAGDSQVFGTGVNDGEVVTNLLNEKYYSFNTYNLGHPTWSPASTYLFFDPSIKFNFKDFMPEKTGIMVYMMFPYLSWRDNHFPTTLYINSGLNAHYVQKETDLILKGSFKDASDLWSIVKKMSAYYDKDQFLEQAIMPAAYLYSKKRMHQEAFENSAFILAKMRNRYLELFPGSAFYVAICDKLGEDEYDLLKDELNYQEIQVVDLRNEQVCNSTRQYSYPELNFNPEGHRELMRVLENYILNPNREFLGF